jgi:hypothetical protein
MAARGAIGDGKLLIARNFIAIPGRPAQPIANRAKRRPPQPALASAEPVDRARQAAHKAGR